MLNSHSHLSAGVSILPVSMPNPHAFNLNTRNITQFSFFPRFKCNRKQLLCIVPAAHSTRPQTESFFQTQLNNAIKYNDIEACVYLFRHHGIQEKLSITSTQIRTIIEHCFHRRVPEQAVSLLRSMPQTHPSHFSIAMKECLKRKDLITLDKILEAREDAGFIPDRYSTSAQITAYGVAKDSAAALSALHAAWKIPSCRQIEVCNAAIGACAASGDLNGALSAFEFISKSGLSPDAISYNCLMKAAGMAKAMDKVVSLYEDLRASNIRPSPQTFTVVFKEAARNAYSDADWLSGVFQSMPMDPNDYILSSFISALSFAHCTRSHHDAVFAALADARAKEPLNDTTYSALLVFLTRQKIADRAVDVWSAALQDGVALSPHFLSALFSACAAGSSPALVDVAVDAYSSLRKWWSLQDKRRVPAWLEQDVRVAYNSLLHLVDELHQVDEALAVFEDMKREGPLPDTVTYNTIIGAVGSSGDADAALHLFAEMNDAGIEPTAVTFGALLHAYATVGDALGAQQIFSSLKGARIEPNTVLYTSYINALVKSGDAPSLQIAFNMVEEMRSVGLKPTVVTYGCLLNACEKTGDVPRAFALYQCACAEGIVPSDEMHNILIAVCTRGGRLDEALDLVKGMARKHAQLRQDTLNSLIRALCPTSPGRALRMLSLMQTMKMQPTRGTYLALIVGCAKSSDSLEAMALYTSMRSQGMEVDGSSGSALIACLCQAQRLEDAVSVYDEMMASAWRRDNGTKNTYGRSSNNNNSNNNNMHDIERNTAAHTRSNNTGNNDTNSTNTTNSWDSNTYDDTDSDIKQDHHQHHQPSKGNTTRRSALSKRAHVPESSALAWLAQSHAAAGKFNTAWRFYKQLRRSSQGLQEATVTHRRLFEILIEGHCRQKMVKRALIVFDDWKSASSRWFARQDKYQDTPSSGTTTSSAITPAAITPAAAASDRTSSGVSSASATDSTHHNSVNITNTPSSSSNSVSSSSPPPLPGRTPKLSYVSLAFLEACCRSEPDLQWRVYDVCSVMRMQKERKVQESLDRPQKVSHHVLGSVQEF